MPATKKKKLERKENNTSPIENPHARFRTRLISKHAHYARAKALPETSWGRQLDSISDPYQLDSEYRVTHQPRPSSRIKNAPAGNAEKAALSKKRKRQTSSRFQMQWIWNDFRHSRSRKREKKTLAFPLSLYVQHQNSLDNIFHESEHNNLGDRSVRYILNLLACIAFYFKGYYLIRFFDLAPLFPSFYSLSACLLTKWFPLIPALRSSAAFVSGQE